MSWYEGARSKSFPYKMWSSLNIGTSYFAQPRWINVCCSWFFFCLFAALANALHGSIFGVANMVRHTCLWHLMTHFKQHSYLDLSRVSNEFKRWESRPLWIFDLSLLAQIAWAWTSCHCRSTAVLFGTSSLWAHIHWMGMGFTILATSVLDQLVHVWSQHHSSLLASHQNYHLQRNLSIRHLPQFTFNGALCCSISSWAPAAGHSTASVAAAHVSVKPVGPFRTQGAKSYSSNHSMHLLPCQR